MCQAIQKIIISAKYVRTAFYDNSMKFETKEKRGTGKSLPSASRKRGGKSGKTKKSENLEKAVGGIAGAISLALLRFALRVKQMVIERAASSRHQNRARVGLLFRSPIRTSAS